FYRRFDVRGENRTRGRHVRGQHVNRAGWHDVLRLMWIQHEYMTVVKVVRTAFDATDAGVAVLDRRRKIAGLKRGAHALIFARRNTAAKHERFRAAADAAVHRAYDHRVSQRRLDPLAADLAAARLHDPERARDVVVRHAHNFCALRDALQSRRAWSCL